MPVERDRLRMQTLSVTSDSGRTKHCVLFATCFSDYLARSEETANRAIAEYSTHAKCAPLNNLRYFWDRREVEFRSHPTAAFGYVELPMTRRPSRMRPDDQPRQRGVPETGASTSDNHA